MIDPQSRSLEWIEQASALIPNIADTALVEKAIRALSLLESLVRSGCPFVFKGGTALMQLKWHILFVLSRLATIM